MSMEMNVQEATSQPTVAAPEQLGSQQQVQIKDLKVNTENDALNYMVGFLELAQRRGVFTLEEAAKINECVSKFRRPATDAPSSK